MIKIIIFRDYIIRFFNNNLLLMLFYINICFLILSFVSSQGITIKTKDYSLKRTDSTYALYMKSDEYQNNYSKKLNVDYPNGFYIAKLENKNSELQAGFGSITIKIKKDSSEEELLVYCLVSDLSSENEGIGMLCDNKNDYDSIELSPKEGDSVKIEEIEQIKLSNTKTEGNTGAKPENNETKGENGSSLIKFNGEYLVFLLALVLFI